jgi:hypothetical protein
MPFTTQEIQDAGKIGLDYYVKNKPIDQVAIERPLLTFLMGRKKSAPGAKQYIVEQLRYRYQSNFQWFSGSQVVTYNKRQTIEQAMYAWRSAHDGFSLDEDRLAQNGIKITEDTYPGTSQASEAEKIQLTNLIEEQSEVLRLGFEEKFAQACHLDGTQSADALVGLDALVSLTPSTGTVGAIDRSVAGNAWWRNNAYTGLTTTTTTGTILDKMELGYRACVRNGGRPTKIIAGGDFIDGYRYFLMTTYGRMDFGASGQKRIEGGTEMVLFHGIPLEWSPEFDDLDDVYAPGTTWKKRCYMLNGNHIKLRPLEGHDMITRKPPRAYDKYEYYWGLTWRGALTMNRGNAHCVFALS